MDKRFSRWGPVAFPLFLGLFVLFGCTEAPPPSADEVPSERVEAFFNDPLVDFPELRDRDALGGDLVRRLIRLIDEAERSLDAAVYHLTDSGIVTALERACGRGVRVRLVLERDLPQAERLPSCARVRWDENERAMHHKFLMVDGQRVWTGSANFTPSSLYFDANHALLLESPEVARAFSAEFAELWRGRFGPRKRDTNEERFVVGDVPLELYMTPSDRPRERLLELIEGAEESVRLAMFILTDDPLYEALLRARERGVRVEAVWDFTGLDGCLYSEVDELVRKGVGVLDALPGLLHNKYAVLDGEIVIAGSANWSKSGLERNDENLVVIHSREVAERFLGDFQRLLEDARAYGRSLQVPPRLERRTFSVVRDGALLQWRPRASGLVERYEICRLDAEGRCGRVFEVPGEAWYFVDREVIPGEVYRYRVRARTPEGFTEYSNPVTVEVPDGIPLLSASEAERELSRYEGQVVTVRFVVRNRPRFSPSGHLFLNAGEDYRTDFTAFIPGCALELGRFDGSGLDLLALQGRTIEVTGELEEYQGPEIVVTGPWQIRVLDDRKDGGPGGEGRRGYGGGFTRMGSTTHPAGPSGGGEGPAP